MTHPYDGARAMSAEELKRLAEQQADGMRNAWPACEHNRLAAQQNMNAWKRDALDAMPIAQFPPKPKRTRWQRLMAWIKA